MSFEYEVLPELSQMPRAASLSAGSLSPLSPTPVYEPIVFTVSPVQVAKFKAWKVQFPYSGSCCGGDFTFSFTPTSIGTIVTIVHGKTGSKLELYDDME